jgi:hypothetical protein
MAGMENPQPLKMEIIQELITNRYRMMATKDWIWPSLSTRQRLGSNLV